MLTFSLNKITAADAYASRVWVEIQKNIAYFKAFNGDQWKEAVTRTYMTALDHKKPSYTDVTPYIKKLARTILKEKQNETPHSVATDDGEIAAVFRSLTDSINVDHISTDIEEIRGAFKELYLMDSEAFLKLQVIFMVDKVSELDRREDRVRNKRFTREFLLLVERYGDELVYPALYEFLKEIPTLTGRRVNAATKLVQMKPGNDSMLQKVSDQATIVDQKGKAYTIDKTTFTMARNPDYFKWVPIGQASDVVCIDFSEYMNFLYEEIFVDEGINTRHVSWCGDRYKLESPAGEVYIGLDREKFIASARMELLLNLLSNNVGTVVAVSADNLYVRPARSFTCEKVRIKFANGKSMDLPVTTYLNKRQVVHAVS